MALEGRPVVVAPREKIDENHSGIDRWMEGAGWLDRPSAWVQRGILKLYELLGEPGKAVKDVLHGTRFLGHALHPALANVPFGAFAVMVLADWLAVFSRAIPSELGPFCLIVGILGMLAAALAGYTDYTGTDGKERRYASVHGILMTLVLVAMIVSLAMRYRPSASYFFAAILLSTAAYLVMIFGAYLGGHLVFGFGTMVNHNALLHGATEWTAVGAGKDFPEGRMVRVEVGDMPVLVVRLGGRLNAISAACSHAGGPLEEGSLEGDTVTCPWHGSRFCISDGRVVGGPATYSQPALLVREDEGTVQLRLPAPLK